MGLTRSRTLRPADYLAADCGGGNPGEGEDAGRSCVFLPEARGQGREVLVTNGHQDDFRHGIAPEDDVCGGGDMRFEVDYSRISRIFA